MVLNEERGGRGEWEGEGGAHTKTKWWWTKRGKEGGGGGGGAQRKKVKETGEGPFEGRPREGEKALPKSSLSFSPNV